MDRIIHQFLFGGDHVDTGVLTTMIGGGIFLALSSTFGPLLLEKLRHKYSKVDKEDATKKELHSCIDSLDKRLDEVKSSFDDRFESVDSGIRLLVESLDSIKEITGALCQSEIARTHESIRRQALLAIKAKTIKARDLESLLAEYKRYKALPNVNGYLDETMNKVRHLPITVEDEDI